MTIYEVGTLALSATATLFAALAYIAPVKAPAPGPSVTPPTCRPGSAIKAIALLVEPRGVGIALSPKNARC